MLMFDVETLSTSSDSVILSAALIHFNPEEKPSYDELLGKAIFVKFNAKEQVEVYNRKVSKETLEWWGKQHSHVKKASFTPSSLDVSAKSGLSLLEQYMDTYDPKREQTIWARGSLDQLVIDDLSKTLDFNTITDYTKWRDVRTAVDIMYGSGNGYCDVEYAGFVKEIVVKHHPVHDCAYDIMQLLYGKEKKA